MGNIYYHIKWFVARFLNHQQYEDVALKTGGFRKLGGDDDSPTLADLDETGVAVVLDLRSFGDSTGLVRRFCQRWCAVVRKRVCGVYQDGQSGSVCHIFIEYLYYIYILYVYI